MSVKKIVLKKAAFGYGFSLKDNGERFPSTATIVRVEPGGAADLSGIRVGDRVRAINGRPVQSMSFLEASNAVRVSSQFVELELDDQTTPLTNPEDSLPAGLSYHKPPSSSADHSDPRPHRAGYEGIPTTSLSDHDVNTSVPRIIVAEATNFNVGDATTSNAVTDGPISISRLSPTSTDLISSLPCTKMNPTRLSISISDRSSSVDCPSTRTTFATSTVASTTTNNTMRRTSARPVPLARRTRTPLAAFNQSLEPHHTGSNQLATIELVASTPSNVRSTSKECTSPVSPSIIFDGPKLVEDKSPQSEIGTSGDSMHVVEPDHPKDASLLGTVRIRHLDANVTKKAHRRQTFTRACLDGNEGDSGMPPVRFVRKRAYASARQAGRFDQFAAFSLSPEDAWPYQSPTLPASGNAESSTSPCQLLPANPQPLPPSNVHVVEPKITHLPRRRSSKGQSNRPSTSIRRSRTSGEYRKIEDPVPLTVAISRVEETKVTDMARRSPEHVNLDVKSETVSSPDSVTQVSESTEKPSEAPIMNVSRTQDPEEPAVTKPSRPTTRLWASFDSDPDDSPFDWWSRAGETYQQLDLEYQRLMKRHSRIQQRRRPMISEPGNNVSRSSNKENKVNGPVVSDTRELDNFTKGRPARMSVSIGTHATWSSPISRRSDKSPVFSVGSSQADVGDLQLNSQNGITRRRQLLYLCSGLRYHRSESNIHHDVNGSFRSRQSLCKILALDGSTNKSFSWKPYYMCISGSEVRFIKASTFSSGNRKSKSAKQLSDMVAASRNPSLLDLTDDSRTWDGSLNSTRSGYSISDAQAGPVSVTSSSCVILPLPGLIWAREGVPQDLPHWRPLAPTTVAQHTRKPSPIPDIMDPFFSGLSEPGEHMTVSMLSGSAKTTNSTEESALRATMQCYRFAHVDAGVELLFVFPDKNTAMACLKMCEMNGGREASSLDSRMSSDSEWINRKPYDLLFLGRPQSRLGSSLSESVRTTTSGYADRRESTGHSIRPEISRPVATLVPVQPLPSSNTQCKLTDRRQRRLDKQSVFSEDSVTCTLSNPVSTAALPLEDHPLLPMLSTSSTDPHSVLNSTSTVSHTDGATPSEDRSSQRSSKSRNATPFLRGFKQWLNRPAFPYASSSSVSEQSGSSTPNTMSMGAKLSAILAEPADLSDFESPGAIFGAALEKQIPSPDHVCVPVILHALVLGLETHGLQLAGLYRKPGRHRTIAQFVCVANLVPENVDLLLKLDAWREPNALCGLVKQFLRRLPVGLFISATWEPLASLVDGHSSNNPSQTAYLLLSIRVKLRKLACEALGIPSGHIISSSVNSPERPSETEPTAGSPGTGQNRSKTSSPTPSSPCADELRTATWRWATLCFLVDHIREVVAYRHMNEVSYQCIAICFGPVFFGDSTNLARLNGVLENLFRHWPWLIQGLPLVTQDTLGSTSTHLEKPSPDYTLAEAIDYLTHCESTSRAHVPSPEHSPSMGPQKSPDSNEATTSSPTTTPPFRSNEDPDASAERHDHVCQVVRTLLERAVRAKSISEQSGPNESNTTSATLYRVSSAVSSVSALRNTSTTRSATPNRRRKTMDVHNTCSLSHNAQIEFRRPKPGRAGLNPRHLEPIRGELQSGFSGRDEQANSASGLNMGPEGVIPRPSVPARTYYPPVSFDHTLTKSPS